MYLAVKQCSYSHPTAGVRTYTDFILPNVLHSRRQRAVSGTSRCLPPDKLVWCSVSGLRFYGFVYRTQTMSTLACSALLADLIPNDPSEKGTIYLSKIHGTYNQYAINIYEITSFSFSLALFITSSFILPKLFTTIV